MSTAKLTLILAVLVVVFAGSYALIRATDQQGPANGTEQELQAKVQRQAKEISDWESRFSALNSERNHLNVQVTSLSARVPPEVKPLTPEELAQHVSELKARLDKAMTEGDPSAFLSTVEAFLQLDEAAYPQMAMIVKDLAENPEKFGELFEGGKRRFRRMYQYRLMALSASPKTLKFAMFLAKSQELPPKFRANMVEGLPFMGMDNPAAVELLKDLAQNDPEERVAREAVEALGDFQDVQYLSFFRGILEDPTTPARVRQKALRAIGQIEDDAAVAILQQYANGEDAELKRTAQNYLPDYSDSEIARAEAKAARSAEAKQRAVWKIESDAQSSMSEYRNLVEDARMRETLVELATTDADPARRLAAFGLLQYLPAEVAVPAIVSGMQGQTESVRRAGVVALGESLSFTPESIAVLRGIAQNDPDEVTRQLADRYLQSVREE